MTSYEAIFQRHSVRKFQMKPIEAKTMEQLNGFMQTVSVLHPDALYRIAVVESDGTDEPAIKGKFTVEAPYYLVFSAKEHPYAAQNAGYVLEQIVLYLLTKGIATCYLGGGKPVAAADGYRAIIVVAFGRPYTSMYGSRARRKALPKMVHYKEEATAQVRRILEAGRLAPSALNRQPWQFIVYSNRIHIFMEKKKFLLGRWKELMEISMGILMVHMALAAEEQWLNWKLQMIDGVAEKGLKGYQYIATLTFSEQAFPQG